MKFVSYSDPVFKFTGVWQENDAQELVSYRSSTFMEIGFVGRSIEVIGTLEGDLTAWIDNKPAAFTSTQTGFSFTAGEGRHSLKIRTLQGSHLHLKGVCVADDAELFRCPDKFYIHFIGDSITEAFPGFATPAAEKLGADLSIVAVSGMSLTDGWGWYHMPEGVSERLGMESNYFLLERPYRTRQFTPYRFQYCRIPDAIVIFLGTNDYLDTPEDEAADHINIFASRFHSFIGNIRKHFPNVPIYLLQALSDKHCRKRGIAEAYAQISKDFARVALIPSHTWQVEISSDGTHPTPAGYQQMADHLAEYLRENL